jgi:anti-sigma factor RsiW
MPCDQWRAQIDAYLDRELSASDSRAMADHLQQCPNCTAAVLEHLQLKRAIATVGPSDTPSAQFRARIMQSVTTKPRPAKQWLWRLVLAPAVLVLLLSLAVNLYVDHEKAERSRVYSELADLHVSTLASGTPVDVVSTDRHTVKPWFEGKLPFTFNLPELQGTDFTLVGGRMTYLGQAPGAHLIYRIRKHELSVFIFQDRGGDTAGLSSGPIPEFSFNAEGWRKNGLRYFVVGDVSAADIESLSNLLRDAA